MVLGMSLKCAQVRWAPSTTAPHPAPFFSSLSEAVQAEIRALQSFRLTHKVTEKPLTLYFLACQNLLHFEGRATFHCERVHTWSTHPSTDGQTPRQRNYCQYRLCEHGVSKSPAPILLSPP